MKLLLPLLIAPALWLSSCAETTEVQPFPKQYYGVGIEIEIHRDKPVVRFVHKNSPAEQAKILKGDVIESIDGKVTKTLSLADVILLIRGKKNSQIVMDLNRQSQSITVVTRRDAITKTIGGYRGQPENQSKD